MTAATPRGDAVSPGDIPDPDGTPKTPSHGDTPRPSGSYSAERLPAELATWPAWTPGEEQLGELELITSGAFAPLTGYLTAADLAAVSARGELADGTPWPVPVTLTVPAAAVPADADRLVLQDQEGSPLAVVSITERAPAPTAPRCALRARSRRCARLSTARSAHCARRPPRCAPRSVEHGTRPRVCGRVQRGERGAGVPRAGGHRGAGPRG